MEIIEVDEFEKDLSKIRVDLEEDLKKFKKILVAEYPKILTPALGSVIISHLGKGILPVYKARKFRCKALNKGSRSGIRVIYTYDKYADEIILIEIYSKSKKDNQDLYRIRKYAIKEK